MAIYKLIPGANGPRYQKDKRFISKNDIPISVLEKLEMGKEVSDDPIQPKQCIFCNVGGCRLTRLVNREVVYLCEEDYYARTIGKVAEQIRTMNEKQKENREEVSVS